MIVEVVPGRGMVCNSRKRASFGFTRGDCGSVVPLPLCGARKTEQCEKVATHPMPWSLFAAAAVRVWSF